MVGVAMSDLYMFVFSHVQNRFFRKHWLESLRYTQIRSHAQTPELLERRTMKVRCAGGTVSSTDSDRVLPP